MVPWHSRGLGLGSESGLVLWSRSVSWSAVGFGKKLGKTSNVVLKSTSCRTHGHKHVQSKDTQAKSHPNAPYIEDIEVRAQIEHGKTTGQPTLDGVRQRRQEKILSPRGVYPKCPDVAPGDHDTSYILVAPARLHCSCCSGEVDTPHILICGLRPW